VRIEKNSGYQLDINIWRRNPNARKRSAFWRAGLKRQKQVWKAVAVNGKAGTPPEIQYISAIEGSGIAIT